jgi:hypothetical protein
VVRSIFYYYQVVAAAHVRTLDVGQGLLQKFGCEIEYTSCESQKIEAELLDAAKQFRAMASRVREETPDAHMKMASYAEAFRAVDVGACIDVALLQKVWQEEREGLLSETLE